MIMKIAFHLGGINSHSEIRALDQFYFIEKAFNEDRNTRRAIITIGDPPKDCFDNGNELKVTKDFPCTQSLHFMKQSSTNKLNLTVYMRSNDILWGASAVNIFNYTFLLEYFAQILGCEIGEYHHIVNNFHFYENYRDSIVKLANTKNAEDQGFVYNKSFNNLSEFDEKLLLLSNFEKELRVNPNISIIDLNDEFYNDWLKILYAFTTKKKIDFLNPILNNIFN